jgi:hypothetical protein
MRLAGEGARLPQEEEIMSLSRFRSRGWRQGPAIVGVCLAALSVSACGGSGRARTHTAGAHSVTSSSVTACQPKARAAIARFLAGTPARIAASASTGNNGMPQCSFRARAANTERVDATANIYTGAQPYFTLERTAVEAAQVFGPKRLTPAPQAVTGLGLEADWFPAYPQLMATDGIRLITVSVSWRGATQSRERALAETLARTYLRTPRGKAAAALANGYPSG